MRSISFSPGHVPHRLQVQHFGHFILRRDRTTLGPQAQVGGEVTATTVVLSQERYGITLQRPRPSTP